MNERIKEVRNVLGYTQEEFSQKLGVVRNTVTNYESGSRTPSDAIIRSICREFGVRKEWLLTGQGEMFDRPDEDFLKMSMSVEKNENPFLKEFTKILWGLDVEELEALQKIVNQIKNNPNL